MAYVIEIPVEAGGRLLVQASAEDLPGSLELASLRPGAETGAVIAKGTAEVHISGGGYAVLTDDGYKVYGDVGDDLWWVIKMCRFGPGELDGYVPGLRQVPAEEPLPLIPATGSEGGNGGRGVKPGSLGIKGF